VAYGFANTYESEEAAAKAARRGIWAGTFMPPSQWRQDHNE
jgi:endonuclease YncB( thermonuclease family)